MKLSELSTDRTLDVLLEVTPHINNITTDKEILDIFAEKMDVSDMTAMAVNVISASRYNSMLSLLLKNHRKDVYGILSALNEKTTEEIAAQPIVDTIRQVRELFQDEELLSFFKSSARREQTVPSAPSAASPASE